MRVKVKYRILILIPFLFACSEKHKGKTLTSEIIEDQISKEISSEEPKDEPCYFINDRAKKKCDSTLIQVFGPRHFKRKIKWSEEHSFINCDVNESVELMRFGDSSCCAPRTFDLIYDIVIGTNSIYQFRMTAGPDEVFEPVSKIVVDQLLAYRKLMDGEFKIDYNRAKQIANKNGYSGKNMTVELHYSSKGNLNPKTTFYWEVDAHKTDVSREILHIDPYNGKVETISLECFTIACG